MTDHEILPPSLRTTTSDEGDDHHRQAQGEGRRPGRPCDADQDQERHRDPKPNRRLSDCNMATAAATRCDYRPAATLQPPLSAITAKKIKIGAAASILSS